MRHNINLAQLQNINHHLFTGRFYPMTGQVFLGDLVVLLRYCFGVNLRRVKSIRKELDETNVAYEGTANGKTYSDRSEKKGTRGIAGEDTRLKTEAGIKCAEEVVLTWVKRLATSRPNVFQQDSEPCHPSRKKQSCLSGNFCDFTFYIGSPNALHCNNLDCYSDFQ